MKTQEEARDEDSTQILAEERPGVAELRETLS